MTTERIKQLQQAIDAFPRPRLSFASIGAAHASLAAAQAWDAANPVDAAAREKLVAELEAATKAQEALEAERERVDRAMRQMAGKLSRSGIGERSLEAARAAEDTEALGVVKRWLPKREQTWLVLCGPKGTGKSVAATWALMQTLQSTDARHNTGAFRLAPALAKLSQFEAGAAEMEYLKGVALLVVDDFGTELLNDYARAQLFELLDARHESYGRTIITSNLSWGPTKPDLPWLEQRLGERLADRIRQAGTVQQIAHASMRRRVA